MPKKRVKLPSCPNCGLMLQNEENFCPECGQENHRINRPVIQLWRELMENVLNIDSRFFHTVRALLLKPGKLTRDFNYGKRRYYIPPIRIYLFASLAFFLVQSLTHKKALETSQEVAKEFQENPTDTIALNLGTQSLYVTNAEAFAMNDLEGESLDSFLLAHDMTPNYFNRRIVKQGARAVKGDTKGLMEEFNHLISIAMFLLMPVFALLLQLFYRKQKKFYIEHLIFSLHFHSAAFLILTINTLLSFIPKFSAYGTMTSLLLLFIYLIASMKNVYAERWSRTILKFIGLISIYGIFFLFVLSIIGLLALMYF